MSSIALLKDRKQLITNYNNCNEVSNIVFLEKGFYKVIREIEGLGWLIDVGTGRTSLVRFKDGCEL